MLNDFRVIHPGAISRDLNHVVASISEPLDESPVNVLVGQQSHQ